MTNIKENPKSEKAAFVKPSKWSSAMIHSSALVSQFKKTNENTGVETSYSVVKLNEYNKEGKVEQSYSVVVNSKLITPFKIDKGDKVFSAIKDQSPTYNSPFLKISVLTDRPVSVSVPAKNDPEKEFKQIKLSPNKFKSILIAETAKTSDWVKTKKEEMKNQKTDMTEEPGVINLTAVIGKAEKLNEVLLKKKN